MPNELKLESETLSERPELLAGLAPVPRPVRVKNYELRGQARLIPVEFPVTLAS